MYSKEKRKKIKYLIITILLVLIPIKVNASFTLGNVAGTINSSNNNITFNKQCTNNGYCNWGSGITNFLVTCTTPQCYIVFPVVTSEAHLTQNNTEMNATSIYTQVYGTGAWHACETQGGNATCPVPRNTTITNIEFKWYSFQQNQGVSFDANFITVYNEPAAEEAYLRNITEKLAIIAQWNVGDNQSVVNSINTLTQQEQTNWNNFNNQDISQQAQTQPDYSDITNTETEENTQINNIKNKFNTLTEPTMDILLNTNAFSFIWSVIQRLWNTKTQIINMIIFILSMGFIKLIFNR